VQNYSLLLLSQSSGIGAKLFSIILSQSSGIGVNFFISFILVLFQSFGIRGKLFLYYFIPIFWNWRKIPPNYCHLLAILFIYIVFLPLFGYCGGKISRH
jgi:hypothetical protein